MPEYRSGNGSRERLSSDWKRLLPLQWSDTDAKSGIWLSMRSNQQMMIMKCGRKRKLFQDSRDGRKPEDDEHKVALLVRKCK